MVLTLILFPLMEMNLADPSSAFLTPSPQWSRSGTVPWPCTRTKRVGRNRAGFSASLSSTCPNKPMAPSQGDKGVSSWQRRGRQLAGVPRPPHLTCQPQPCQPHLALPRPHVLMYCLLIPGAGRGKGRGQVILVQPAVSRWPTTVAERLSGPWGVTHGPVPLAQQSPTKCLYTAVTMPASSEGSRFWEAEH